MVPASEVLIDRLVLVALLKQLCHFFFVTRLFLTIYEGAWVVGDGIVRAVVIVMGDQLAPIPMREGILLEVW